jgi:hypothetical protein
MRRPALATPLLILALCAPVALQASETRLYKWVDENGNVHYSDRVESSASPKAGEVRRITSTGIAIGNRHSALPVTREDVLRQQEAQRLAQLDTMLLSSYQSELELLRAHDASREPIESGLRAAEGNIMRLRAALAARESGQPAAPGAGADVEVERLRKLLRDEEASLERLRTRRFELYEQQNFEVARYRELTTRNS